MKWLKLLCIVSLMLNGLLIGLLVGRGTYHRPPQRFEQLSPALQARMKESMDQVRKANESDRRALTQARQKVIDTLSKEPFDEKAYQAALREVHQLKGRMTARMAEAVKDIALTLPPEERPAIAKMLSRPPSGKPSRPDDRGSRDQGPEESTEKGPAAVHNPPPPEGE